jgi:uncharacterized protein (UPF0305 family)
LSSENWTIEIKKECEAVIETFYEQFVEEHERLIEQHLEMDRQKKEEEEKREKELEEIYRREEELRKYKHLWDQDEKNELGLKTRGHFYGLTFAAPKHWPLWVGIYDLIHFFFIILLF